MEADTHDPVFNHKYPNLAIATPHLIWSDAFENQDLTPCFSLLLITNFTTLAQKCQPPNVPSCAPVLAYFHKHFQEC
jgi:hypothetical protein